MSGNPAKKPESVYSAYMPNEAVALDADAFDSFVANNGVRLIHFRALPCPLGLQDPNDIRHHDHTTCSNGNIYRPMGRVTAFFMTNQTTFRKLDPGFVLGSTVAVTLPRFYDADPTRRIMVQPSDRFYLEEDGITSLTSRLMQRRRDDRPDRPPYPAVAVEQLVDASGVFYRQDVDFAVQQGDIVWRAGRGPEAGTVYSTSFEYKPYWYVDRLVHEVRIIPAHDYLDQNIIRTERLSFAVILNREYVHRDQRQDPRAPNREGRQGLPNDRPAQAGDRPAFDSETSDDSEVLR